jgi:hypothetical protein
MEQYNTFEKYSCPNTKITFYLRVVGVINSLSYLNVVHFFNTSVNLIYVAAYDSCFRT